MSSNSRRAFTHIFAVAVLASALSLGAAMAQVGPPAPPPHGTPMKVDAAKLKWREALARIRPGKGCFKASYPKVAWRQAPCTTAPNFPYATGSQTVGAGVDYSGSVAGLMNWADGTFTPSGLTSETGYLPGTTNEIPNMYSIQINTNPFVTSVCSGAANPSSCKGWQQFIYTSARGIIFMQYWLLNYGATCPDGWNTSKTSCYRNSEATYIGLLTIDKLATTEMTAAVDSVSDGVILWVDDFGYIAPDLDSVLYLSKGWTQAEFNIFGDCCSSSANFNLGTKIWVNLQVGNGTKDIPSCPLKGYTAETNNLILSNQPPPVINAGSLPVVSFMEANPAGSQGQTCYSTIGFPQSTAAAHR